MPHRPAAEVVLEHLPTGVVVLDDEGRLTGGNPAAQRLLGELPADGETGCCELVGCRRPGTPLEQRCITEAVRAAGSTVGELLVQTPAGGAWVTAVPIDGGGVLLHLRTDEESAGTADERLRIRVLGPMQLESGGAVLDGDWLAHRPGQVLKYLVAARGRPVTADELLGAFWPQNEGTPAATNVRQAVHALRDRMEPERERQAASRYIDGRRGGGYELIGGRVLVDADVFTSAAEAGLAALRDGDTARADATLSRAAGLYRGDFLADEPDAEWALPERARLRTLAGRVLRALAGIRVRASELDAASELLQRLAELEPLDVEAQRQLLTLLLRRGRRSEAARRYEVVARRFRRAFGEEPGFELSELARSRTPSRR
ncbi:MAG TPA: BTAD domain-containing putative transcriptional regulator [Solirubrobacteraceae bacterium]|nr:BTAD domain-containing putative transcriptional regulator [Solirubrobacteraceae bacterium]